MICPKCNTDNCISEVENKLTTYFCVGCGYRTRSDYNTKNFEFQPTLIHLDEKAKKMLWKDTKTGLYWFPISVDIPTIGILYPQGTVENIEWVYMPLIEISDQEKKKYPGKKELPDEYGKKIFNSSNLIEALKLLKILQ